MIVLCDECGSKTKMPPSQYKRAKNHFCSKGCHMKFMNRELNPTRMTDEIKEKIRQSKIGKGECKSYEKTHGKHTHRIVAEQMIGRPLKPGEIVHHKDGNKRNNKMSNLKVMTQAEHCRLHFSKGGDSTVKY